MGWVAWRVLQSKMVTCEVCGASTLASSNQCPLCGANLETAKQSTNSSTELKNSIPASSATIDVTVKKSDLEK